MIEKYIATYLLRRLLRDYEQVRDEYYWEENKAMLSMNKENAKQYQSLGNKIDVYCKRVANELSWIANTPKGKHEKILEAQEYIKLLEGYKYVPEWRLN